MKLFLVFTFLVTLGLAGKLSAQVKKELSSSGKPFFFIQLSDPQFGFMDSNRSITGEIEAMNKAVKIINRLKPAFIVVTGDLVNDSKDEKQIKAYQQIIARVDPSIPVYAVPGNHDIGMLDSSNIEAYRKHFCNTCFSFRYKNCAFIGLHSNVMKNEDKEREEAQYKWLEKELKKAKRKKFKFVFTHHSIFLKDINEKTNYSNLSPAMRTKYISLLKKYNVNAVFAGHLHDNAYGKTGDLEMVTIGAVGKPLGKGYQGMNVVKVYPEHYSFQYMALDEFPEEITF